MELLQEYGLFLAKAVTLVAAIGVIIGLLVAAGHARRAPKQGYIEVRKYNDDVSDMSEAIEGLTMDKFQLKQRRKKQQKKHKQELKQAKQDAKSSKDKQEAKVDDGKPQHYVLDFDGDIYASDVDKLRQEITAVLAVANSQDEVIVRLESAGGMVHTYGLAASQLARIRAADIKLTICVDRVAASGGYMMACLANKIIAAPFALVGSIGVVAEVPNIHRLLKKHDIDVEVLTAGEHKRSLTVMGENTRKGKDKFMEDLQITHDLFKNWVSEQRPQVNIKEVANGDVWYGQQALNNQLVDALGTSDDYLQQLIKDQKSIILVSYEEKKSVGEKLGLAAAGVLQTLTARLWTQSRHNNIQS
ncbi:MAG: protease SohB [Gammaproteobacteria bacterium]|nr:protease SohB [Gammaproteobacteria bacterium]